MNILNNRYNLQQYEMIINGDFNIDYAKTHNALRTDFNSIMVDYGLRQIIKKHTRVTNKSKSIIDLIFTNIREPHIENSGVIDIAIYDHMPVYLNKKARRHKHPKQMIKCRTYHNYNYQTLSNVLFDNVLWIDYWRIQGNPDKLWDIMRNIIISSVDVLCPVRNVVIHEDQLPWIDKTLRISLISKDRSYRKACKTQSADDWNEYHRQKTASRKLFIAKKREYIVATLEENKDDPRRFWQELGINLKIGKSKKVSKVCTQIRRADEWMKTGMDAATCLNEFYVSVGQDLAKKFPVVNPIADKFVDQRRKCSFRFVGTKEVKSVVLQFKNNKSTNVSNINMKVILLLELIHLVNECLDLSIMPQEWKVGSEYRRLPTYISFTSP